MSFMGMLAYIYTNDYVLPLCIVCHSLWNMAYLDNLVIADLCICSFPKSCSLIDLGRLTSLSYHGNTILVGNKHAENERRKHFVSTHSAIFMHMFGTVRFVSPVCPECLRKLAHKPHPIQQIGRTDVALFAVYIIKFTFHQ